MATVIRKYGTPLVRVGAGHYETEDGRYEVARDDHYMTWCDEPHPVKLPREKWYWDGYFDSRDRWVKKLVKGTFCEGGAEHYYTRWHIWDLEAGEYAFDDGPGAYETFAEAAEALTHELAREAAGEAAKGREHAYKF